MLKRFLVVVLLLAANSVYAEDAQAITVPAPLSADGKQIVAMEPQTEAIHEELRALLQSIETAINSEKYGDLKPYFSQKLRVTTINQNVINTPDGIDAYFKEWFGEGGYLKKLDIKLEADALTELYGAPGNPSWGLVYGAGVENYQLTDGRFADRTYLDAIGWRGIRIRKQHIEALLAKAAALLRADSQPVRIMDIAAGHGRYALEAALAVNADHVLLRDYSELNVTGGRALIQQLGLENKAQFTLADAFDAQSIAAVTPKPTLAIVSGLYELFPENAPIQASLAGVHQALEAGAYLIYTNQPWHPQLELIARTLTSHRQKDGINSSWIMRRRTQREMDQLVANAGFEKIDQWSDTWGIFSVSLAKRL